MINQKNTQMCCWLCLTLMELKKAFNFKQVSYSHGNFNQEKFATDKMQMISQCF